MREKKTAPAVLTWIRRGLLMGLLSAAVFLGWRMWKIEEDVQPLQPPIPVHTDGRTAREAAYEKDQQALERLIGQSGEALSEQASQRLLQMVNEHQSELALEETLRQAGYDNVLVLVHNASVTVMLAQEQMNAQSAASIVALCVAHTGVDAENVRIMPLH